jgi:DNA processing protein
MSDLQHRHYQRIAFTLIASRYQKARRRAIKKNIGPTTLPGLNARELELLGFPDEAIKEIRHNYIAPAEAEVAKAKEYGIHIIFKEDEYFPPLLEEIYDPPDFIYALGNREVLKTDKLAVVGARKASAYGKSSLTALLPDLCKAGLTIVSGMAYGIDSMAHTIALREGGGTIGVNGGGLLHLYPIGNKGMIDQVIEHGCVISEFALDTAPRPFYFPIRNRIIAGMSKAVLVAEAALKSGSLITARLGLEQNRDIFAIPGRIDAPVSKGANYLIQKGAKLITSSSDVLEEFGIFPEKPDKSQTLKLSKKEEQLMEFLADGEIKSVDYLVDQMEYSVSATISLLMGLILKSLVIEEAGGYRITG